MADIVVGIASSHTPQLRSGVGMWPDHAERDQRNPRLLGRDASFHAYDELLPLAPPGIDSELGADVWDAKYARCQDAISTLAAKLRGAAPDVAIVIGDDQREMFLDDGITAFACFAGESLSDFGISLLTEQPAGRTLGHAFTFPRYRLGLTQDTPIVPIFVNTYYPLTRRTCRRRPGATPSARRCGGR